MKNAKILLLFLVFSATAYAQVQISKGVQINAGGGCTPSGIFGEMLMDNGDGTCVPSAGVFHNTSPYNFQYTSFGNLNAPNLSADTVSCDSGSDTCTMIVANTLNLDTNPYIRLVNGFQDASACLDGYVVGVISITPSQIQFYESNTSCTGDISVSGGGSFIANMSGLTVEGDIYGISLDAGYGVNERYVGVGGIGISGLNVSVLSEDLGENTASTGWSGSTIDSVTETGLDSGHSEIMQTTNGSEAEVTLTAKNNDSLNLNKAVLDLVSNADSTLWVHSGISIENDPGVPILQVVGGKIVAPTLKSLSGTRFLCIDSAGVITSSTTACSGT